MYDKRLLKTWAEMETWDQYLECNGGLNRYSSKEGFQYIERKYFKEVKRRIAYCKKLLVEHDDACVHYTLAQLYDRSDHNESTYILFKKGVRYHCIKAMRKNPNYAPQWELLSESYGWVASIGGDDKNATMDNLGIDSSDPKVQRRILWLADRAVKCIKRAIDLDPDNGKYRLKNKEYCHMKNKAIKMLSSSQNNGISP